MEAPFILKNGKKDDAVLYEEMLSNEEANAKADVLAMKQAMKMGFSEEQAKRMCGITNVKKDKQSRREPLQLIARALDGLVPFVAEFHPRDEKGIFIPVEELPKQKQLGRIAEGVGNTKLHDHQDYRLEVEDVPGGKRYVVHHQYKTSHAADLAFPSVKPKYERLGATVEERGREIVAELVVKNGGKESKDVLCGGVEEPLEKEIPKESKDELCRTPSSGTVEHEFVEEEITKDENTIDPATLQEGTGPDPVQMHHEKQQDPIFDSSVLTTRAEEKLEEGLKEEPSKEVELTDKKSNDAYTHADADELPLEKRTFVIESPAWFLNKLEDFLKKERT